MCAWPVSWDRWVVRAVFSGLTGPGIDAVNPSPFTGCHSAEPAALPGCEVAPRASDGTGVVGVTAGPCGRPGRPRGPGPPATGVAWVGAGDADVALLSFTVLRNCLTWLVVSLSFPPPPKTYSRSPTITNRIT